MQKYELFGCLQWTDRGNTCVVVTCVPSGQFMCLGFPSSTWLTPVPPSIQLQVQTSTLLWQASQTCWGQLSLKSPLPAEHKWPYCLKEISRTRLKQQSVVPWSTSITEGSTWIHASADRACHSCLLWVIVSRSYTRQPLLSLTFLSQFFLWPPQQWLKCHAGSHDQRRPSYVTWLLKLEVPGVLWVWPSFFI